MILAVKRLKTIGWIALIFIVAIALYPLSLSVATLRSDLTRTEREILRTRAEIRYLETEFATRASLTQLAMWNDLEYGYEAPSAAQYLDGERELANLGDDMRQLDKPVRVAAMTIKPQAEPEAIKPSELAASSVKTPEPLSVAASVAIISPARAATAATNAPKAAGATEGKVEGRRLLDDRLLDRINRQAEAEMKKTGGQ
ncbi:MAG: colicin transporter [Blastomonas sp.]|nr:colicin transporter [Blastomonas sp.]